MTIKKKLYQFGPALVVSLLVTACQAPGVVDGVAFESDYSIRDMQPAVRAIGDSFYLVLSEKSGERMRVVTVEVPDTTIIEIDKPITLGPDGQVEPSVSVSTGDLVVLDRADGEKIYTTDNTVFTNIVSGTLTFTTYGETIEGNFRAELTDGGFIDGQFLTDAHTF